MRHASRQGLHSWGLGSLNTALSTVASNAKTLASEAKSTFAPQTTASLR